MNRDFWQGRRVFVTGHTGFKGSWLVQVLTLLDAQVTGYSLSAPTTPSLFEQTNISDQINHIFGDIRDTEHLVKSIQASDAEIIFHLAAQSLVSEGYNDPVETFSTNIIGTQCVLEAIRQLPNVKSVVLVSSDKCYQNKEQSTGYKEVDQLGGNDPYSASKGCMELLINSYQYSFFSQSSSVNIASARAGNVIGGGDWALNRLVPDVLKALENNEVIQLRSPYSTRPWQHVLEPLVGYMRLAEKLFDPEQGGDFRGGWNFGPEPGAVQSVLDVAQSLKSISKSNSNIEYRTDSEFKEAQLLNVDSTKANQKLNWFSRWSIEQTLEYTWRWYKGLILGESASELCKRDIEQYLNFVEKVD